MSIYKGESKKLKITSSGNVTAKKVGTATITAKCGSYSAKCKVTVKKPLSQKESALRAYREFF